MDAPLLLTIATSAAVGSAVTAAANFFAQHRERTARRAETLLARSMELAFRRTDLAKEIADKTGRSLRLMDDVILAEGYYIALDHLMTHGKLPSSFDGGRLKPPDGSQ